MADFPPMVSGNRGVLPTGRQRFGTNAKSRAQACGKEEAMSYCKETTAQELADAIKENAVDCANIVRDDWEHQRRYAVGGTAPKEPSIATISPDGRIRLEERKRKAMDEVDGIIADAKRDTMGDMAAAVPDEAASLLASLARRKRVTSDEAQAIYDEYGTNYLVRQELAEICREKSLRVVVREGEVTSKDMELMGMAREKCRMYIDAMKSYDTNAQELFLTFSNRRAVFGVPVSRSLV